MNLVLFWRGENMCRFIVILGLAAFLALLGGCGGHKPDAGVNVKGKLTKGGQPVTVPNMAARVGTVKVELYPIHTDPNDGRSSFGTLANEDGTFEIVGEGQGVKPGKYKLSVIADPGDGQDQLGGKYGEANSTLEFEISANNVGGTQDLAMEPPT